MKEKKSNAGLGYIIGIGIGLALGAITGRLLLWIAPGIAFGWLIEHLMKGDKSKKENG